MIVSRKLFKLGFLVYACGTFLTAQTPPAATTASNGDAAAD